MPNPTDPFDGLVPDAIGCKRCGGASSVARLVGECPNGHDEQLLISIPAMRRAVVGWLEEQSMFERDKGDKFSGSESLELMARKLERGGHG